MLLCEFGLFYPKLESISVMDTCFFRSPDEVSFSIRSYSLISFLKVSIKWLCNLLNSPYCFSKVIFVDLLYCSALFPAGFILISTTKKFLAFWFWSSRMKWLMRRTVVNLEIGYDFVLKNSDVSYEKCKCYDWLRSLSLERSPLTTYGIYPIN